MDLTKIFSGMDKGPEAIQANFETLKNTFKATYLDGADMTNVNGTNEKGTNFGWRLDFDKVSLLFINLWINDFTGNEAWKSYKNVAIPKSFLNGATKIKTIPEKETQDNGAIVNWTLDTNGQLSVATRGTAIGEHVGIGLFGMFLLFQ